MNSGCAIGVPPCLHEPQGKGGDEQGTLASFAEMRERSKSFPMGCCPRGAPTDGSLNNGCPRGAPPCLHEPKGKGGDEQGTLASL